MRSPFPGMDPYLEGHWGDVHTRLMVYAANQVNTQLPADLQARVEENLAVEVDDQAWRTVYPDVSVMESPGASPTDTPRSSQSVFGVSVAQPCVLMLDEPRTQRHLEIVDMSQRGRVVTVIEILSPSNKVGNAGRLAYVGKQRQYLGAGINLVEIDLIRVGEFVLAAPRKQIPKDYRTPYLICIRRALHPTRVDIYRAPLRKALPNIPIPLRPSDHDVVLQLQPLIDDCYRDGRYNRIDYGDDPVPRLDEEDASWAEDVLREKGLR